MTSRRLLLTLVLNSCVLSTFVRECVYPFVLGVLSCRKNNKKKTFFKHFCWIIVAGHVITFPFFLSFFFVSLFVQASFCRLLSSLLQPTGFHPFFFFRCPSIFTCCISLCGKVHFRQRYERANDIISTSLCR